MDGTARGRQDFLGRLQTTVATTKGIKMSDIVVEFSGWIVADPDKTKFFKVGSLYSEDSGKQDTRPQNITGKQWLELDESEQSDYVLDNLIDAQRDSLDGSYDMIDIEER